MNNFLMVIGRGKHLIISKYGAFCDVTYGSCW